MSHLGSAQDGAHWVRKVPLEPALVAGPQHRWEASTRFTHPPASGSVATAPAPLPQ